MTQKMQIETFIYMTRRKKIDNDKKKKQWKYVQSIYTTITFFKLS